MILKKSSWESEAGKSYPVLTENIEVDVVIVGAGLAGLFNAYILSKAGIKVAVLEKNKNILQGTTLLTTAFISKPVDTPFAELVSLFGEAKAKLVWESGQEAINLITDIVTKEKIECDFQTVSTFIYAQDKKQFKNLTDEYETIRKSGLKADLQKDGKKLNFKNSGFMEISDQAKFHPLKFAYALADKAEAAGAKIFTDSEVISIEDTTVKTRSGRIIAKDIVIATYAPFTNEGTQFKKGMYLSYVFELEIRKGLIEEGLYQDMNNPYHYFRIDSYPDFDRMLVGGEDNRIEIKVADEKNFKALENYVNTVLGANPYKITREWYGLILEPLDGLALIGRIKPHTFVITAFSGSGMTYSAIAALIIRDSILEKKNAYTDLYDPGRALSIKKLLVKGADYTEEFFGGVFKNFFIDKD